MLKILATASCINSNVGDAPDSLFIEMTQKDLNAVLELNKVVQKYAASHNAHYLSIALSNDYWAPGLLDDVDDITAFCHDVKAVEAAFFTDAVATEQGQILIYPNQIQFTCIEKHSSISFKIQSRKIPIDKLMAFIDSGSEGIFLADD